jgi:hypothetical protein
MGVLLSIVASAVVAARLLFVYKRLRQPPELFLGLAYLVAGTLGWGGLLVGALLTPKDQTLSEGYQAWSVVLGDTGTFFFYLFVWYVFRRQNPVAKVVLGVVALVFAASIGRDTILNGVTFGPPPGAATTLAGMTARAVVFAWMAFEAFALTPRFAGEHASGWEILSSPVVCCCGGYPLSRCSSSRRHLPGCTRRRPTRSRPPTDRIKRAVFTACSGPSRQWRSGSRSFRQGPTRPGSRSRRRRARAMADNEEFVAVARVIERATSLNQMQSRGLVRRLLKKAGLDSKDVTAHQLAAVGRALLSEALQKNGVTDTAPVVTHWLDYCARQIEKPRTDDRTRVSNTVEEVFARMGIRR